MKAFLKEVRNFARFVSYQRKNNVPLSGQYSTQKYSVKWNLWGAVIRAEARDAEKIFSLRDLDNVDLVNPAISFNVWRKRFEYFARDSSSTELRRLMDEYSAAKKRGVAFWGLSTSSGSTASIFKRKLKISMWLEKSPKGSEKPYTWRYESSIMDRVTVDKLQRQEVDKKVMHRQMNDVCRALITQLEDLKAPEVALSAVKSITSYLSGT